MRVHIVSLPHTETTKAYSWCAFTQKARKLANMLDSLGWDVRLYGGEQNEAACTESVPVVDREWQEHYFGSQRGTGIDFDPAQPFWVEMNDRATEAIRQRMEPGDILAMTMGGSQKSIAMALPALVPVEAGVGYSGVWAPFRVLESYAWQHFLQGRNETDDIRWFDTVIPNAFEVEDFPAGDGKGDDCGKPYFLFCGRFIRRKGIEVAVETTSLVGAHLVMIGQGVVQDGPHSFRGLDIAVTGTHIEHCGVAGPADRARLMGGATAVFCPSYYLEPFCGVNVEAQMCLPGETLVDAQGVTATHDRAFSGALVHIETERGVVEATPEHPFLTTNGWVPAGALTTGHQLLYNRGYGSRSILLPRIDGLVARLRGQGSRGGGCRSWEAPGVHSVEGSEAGTSSVVAGQVESSSGLVERGGTGVPRGDDRWRRVHLPRSVGWQEESSAFHPHNEYVASVAGVVAAKVDDAQYLRGQSEAVQQVLGGWSVALSSDDPSGRWDHESPSVRGVVALSRHQTPSRRDRSEVDRSEIGGDERAVGGAGAERTGAGSGLYEPATITCIRRREVDGLSVYNLGTLTGAYEANGYIVHNCGTPVITSDHGAFIETVRQGVSGYRCRTLADFVRAAMKVDELDRAEIRAHAISTWSTDVLRHRYDRYFRRVARKHMGGDWYSLDDPAQED